MKHLNVVIGIDVGGTKISAALFRTNGDMVQKLTQLLNQRKGKEVIHLMVSMIQSLMDHAADEAYQVEAIGVCVPGIYNPVNKTVWAPNIPEWDHIHLWKNLKNHLNIPSVELVLESDRSCYILGEAWKGTAQGCTDAIFIAVVMPKWCFFEMATFLIRLKVRNAFRRNKNNAVQVKVKHGHQPTWYYNPVYFRRSGKFRNFNVQSYPIGFFIPPSNFESFFRNKKGLLKFFNRLEQMVGSLSFLAPFSDHYLVQMQIGK